MRRLALFIAFVVTAVLIPGKVKAQNAVAATSHVSASVAAVNGSVELMGLLKSAIPGTRGHSTRRSVGMAIGWLLLVGVVGFALLAVGADKLQIVIRTMQDGIGKSLGTGLLGQMAIVPGAVGVVILLAATIIGILLIPLGLVAFMLMVAGIAMFGFIAVAIMTGAAIAGGKNRDATPHGAMLRAFFTGTAIYLGMWVVAALLSGIPLLGPMVESFAAAVTFIAATTGFGAVLLSYWRGDFKTSEPIA